MARPTRRLYLIVFAAILLLGGGGGWLAANWRGLAAAYHVRRAENLDADPAPLREALQKVEHYDRRRLVAFWEREMAELNRLEAAKTPPLTNALYATLEAERYVFEAGEEIRLTAVFHSPTDREIGWPLSYKVVTDVYSPSVWAADRRQPERWVAFARMMPPDQFLVAFPRSSLAPNSVVRRKLSVRTNTLYSPKGLMLLSGWQPSGVYRIKISWDISEGTEGRWLERWFTVRVLPKKGEPEEKWEE